MRKHYKRLLDILDKFEKFPTDLSVPDSLVDEFMEELNAVQHSAMLAIAHRALELAKKEARRKMSA